MLLSVCDLGLFSSFYCCHHYDKVSVFFFLTPTLATILMVHGLGVRIIVIAGISSSNLSGTASTTCIEAARSETQP